MKASALRKAVLILIGAALIVALGLLVGTARPAAATDASAAVPVVVDLANVQQDGQFGPQGVLPFRHPSGQAELDWQRFEGQFQAPTTGIQVVAPGSPTSLAPTTGPGFDGISSAESFCGCYPPDGAIGVGPNYVVGAVNTAFKVWNKAGAVLVPGTALSSLFSKNAACLPNISDPGVQYDAAAGGHFVLEGLTYDSAFNSSICMAVSVTGDPTGSYWVYGFTVSPAGDLLDFPQIAIGSDAVYLTGNQFQNGTTYAGARVYAYNKSQLFAGQPATSVYHDVGNDAAGFIADSLYPTKGVTAANTAYFLGADNNFATGNNISLWKWNSPFGVNTFTLQGGVTVTSYAQPPKAVEPGGTTDSGDVRNLGAGYYNGTVYGIHTIGCNPGGGTVPCVQWYQLGNVDGAPSLVQQGIVGGSGQSRYYPNLSVDRSGDMLAAYAYASGTEYPGVRHTGRLATDPAGTVQAEAVMKAGEAFINGTRYGDYAGQQLDIDGCTVWHLEEYAKAGVLWGTWIGSMKFAGCGTPDFALSVSPSSQSIKQGQSTSYTVNVTPSGGFSSPVSLSVSGLPAGSGSSFSPNPTTSASTLAVTTSASTPPGSYPLTITGTSGSLTHTTSATLVVQAPAPDFTLSAAPTSRTVPRGGGTSYTVTVQPVNGFTGAVSLSLSGLPSRTSASFSPNPTTSSSTLSVATNRRTPSGSYLLTITGTSSGLTRTTTVTLAVQ